MTEVDPRRVTVEAAQVTSVTTVRRAIRSPQLGIGHPLSGMRRAGLIASGATVEDALSAASRWMAASQSCGSAAASPCFRIPMPSSRKP